MRFVLLLMVFIFFSCSNNSEKILYLAAVNDDCGGTSGETCLRIKEQGSYTWENFSQTIQDFNYKQGHYYRIKVEATETDNPDADPAAKNYKLLEILETSTGPIILDNGAWLVTRINDIDSFGRNPFMRIDLSQNLISGNTGCNRFSAKLHVDGHSLDVVELSSTKMICREMMVESAFLEALTNCSSYKLVDGKLQLFDDTNALLLEADFLKSE